MNVTMPVASVLFLCVTSRAETDGCPSNKVANIIKHARTCLFYGMLLYASGSFRYMLHGKFANTVCEEWGHGLHNNIPQYIVGCILLIHTLILRVV